MSTFTPAHEHPLAGYLLENIERLCQEAVHRSRRDGKSFADLIDHEKALATVLGLLRGEQLSGIDAAVLNDSHLLVYSVGAPWFSGEAVWLIEQFYIRVGPGSSTAALAAVDELGRSLGCSAVVFGTSLAASDKALGRLLVRQGYLPQSSQLIKEL